MLNVDAFPSKCWQYIDMLTLGSGGPAPATVENIDRNGQNFRLRSLGASKSERQTREYVCKMFQKRCTCFFDNVWAISANCGGFGAFWTSAPWSIVNILSIFCYHRHSGVVEAAQIPATIDNILTIDGSSNCCNNIFNFLIGPYGGNREGAGGRR